MRARAQGLIYVAGLAELVTARMADELDLTTDELVEIAARLAESGFLHYLHICVGSENDASVWVPEATYPAGFATYLAAAVRERVDIPIVTVKRINDPMQAEQLIREGQADAVAMASRRGYGRGRGEAKEAEGGASTRSCGRCSTTLPSSTCPRACAFARRMFPVPGGVCARAWTRC